MLLFCLLLISESTQSKSKQVPQPLKVGYSVGINGITAEKMKYAKKVMRKSELCEMGFPEEFLDSAYRESNQSFAQKINPYKKNSPIIFDTEEFDKWRLRKLRDENKAIRRDYF